MFKVCLIEETNVLRLRIESIFSRRNDIEIITIKGKLIRSEKVPVDINYLIIDLDNFNYEESIFISSVRQRTTNKDIPIMLMTSQPTESLVIMAAKHGNINILVKPFSDIDFLKKVLSYNEAPVLDNIKANYDARSEFKLRWSNEYKIGVALIDEEHKLLVDNFEQLYHKLIEGCDITDCYHDMLRFLNKYVLVHFEHEEKIQNELKYMGLEKHLEEHRSFKLQLAKVIEENKNKSINSQDAIKLILFIKEWLIHHILVEDRKICNSIG